MRLLYLFFILGLISIISACGGMKSKETILSNTNSKPAQTNMESYEDLWKKVADKEKDGLPKSALEMVDSIFIMAKSDSNSVQQIKALLHKAKYTGELDEDGVKSGIKLIAQEGLSLSDPIALAISHSLLGELYYNYYMMNVWEINQTTPIQGDPDPDIDTWSNLDMDAFFASVELLRYPQLRGRAVVVGGWRAVASIEGMAMTSSCAAVSGAIRATASTRPSTGRP